MHDREVEDLFARVAHSLPLPTEPDARGLMVRARRAHRRRQRVRVGAGVLVVVIGGLLVVPRALDGDDASTVSTGSFDDGGEGWARLPDGPLSGRTGATAAWTGDEVIVVGGSTFLCPPGADCAGPTDPPFADGAAFDPTTGAWRLIAPAPVGFSNVEGAVVDGDLYLLVACDPGGCLAGDQVALLRYDADADSWSELPSPPNDRHYALAPAGTGLIAYATTDEQGEVPDWQFDVTTAAWTEMADDPLPAVFDRQIVISDDGSTLLLFAAAIDRSSEPADESVLAARLDLSSGRWDEVPSSPSRGFRAWRIDDIVVLEPHFSGNGGLFDPATSAWSPSPPGPDDPSWANGVSGAFGERTAFYGEASGWVLDVTGQRWIEVPPVDDRDTFPDTSVTAVGRDLFVFGGQRWANGSDGELLADAWIWQAPAPPDDGE